MKKKETLNKKKGKIKLPKCAAIVVTPNAEKGVTRTEIMKEARSKIKIEEIGIDYLRPRIAATGAVILEVPGEAGATKADKLADKLREIFCEDTAKITRPVKRADIRLSGLEESISREELIVAMAQNGNCPAAEFKVGEIRRGPMGIGTVWANCPATAAKKLTEMIKMKVGWSMVRIEALMPRLQCYRCLEPGHTRAKCTVPLDRGNRCYRCSQLGHTARGCTGALKCPLCSDIGRPSDHRLGSAACAPPRKIRYMQGNQDGTSGETTSNVSKQKEKIPNQTGIIGSGIETTTPKPKRIPRTRDKQSLHEGHMEEEGGRLDSQPGGTPLPPIPSQLNQQRTPEEAMNLE